MEYSKPIEENKALNKAQPAHNVPSKKKVRIFNSFREQEEEMIAYWASITPQKRLEHLYEMIKISFRISESEARTTRHSRTIKIIKGGNKDVEHVSIEGYNNDVDEALAEVARGELYTRRSDKNV